MPVRLTEGVFWIELSRNLREVLSLRLFRLEGQQLRSVLLVARVNSRGQSSLNGSPFSLLAPLTALSLMALTENCLAKTTAALRIF